MAWENIDKRPIFNRLPVIGYQDNDTVNWLTYWADEKLVQSAEILETFWQNLIPETAPEAYLDYLGYLIGMSGNYWDTKWSAEVKRAMIISANDLWRSRGTLRAIKKVLDIHELEYTIWTNGSLRLAFTLPATFGKDDLRLYVRMPLRFQRTSKEFKEAERTLRNYAPAVVQTKAVFEYFYLGFSKLSDPLFTPLTT